MGLYGEKPARKEMARLMDEASKALDKAAALMLELNQWRVDWGDDVYFEVLAEAHRLRAAFVNLSQAARYIQQKLHEREGGDGQPTQGEVEP